MTVVAIVVPWEYLGDNVTVDFAYTSKILAAGDLEVLLDGLVQASGFTVSGVKLEDGGNVTFAVAPGAGVEVKLRRKPVIAQPIRYPRNDPFPAQVHEDAIDRLTIIAQFLQDQLDGAIQYPLSESSRPSPVLPPLTELANKAFHWNSLGEPIAVVPTDASGTAVTATGSTTPRILAERFGELPNVKDYGATGGGGADEVAAFQLTVDDTTDGTVQMIAVPAGTYAGDLATLVIGTRKIVWVHLGDVAFSTSRPPGSRLFDDLGGNITRPWSVGAFGFSQDAGTSLGTTADQPAVFIVGNADHTGGTTGGSIESAPFKILHTVGDGVKNFESGMTVNLNHSSDGDATNPPSMVGAHIVGRRTALGSNNARTWGANIVARDESLRASDVQLGGVTGIEINLVASGPDVNNARSGLSIFPSSFGTSPDGASSMHTGIRISPSIALGAIDIVHGILIDVQSGPGTFTHGISLRGPFSEQAIDVDSIGQTGVIRLGGRVDSGIHSQLQLTGDDDGGARTIYSRINGTVVSNTNGSETGQFSVNTIQVGSDAVEMAISGGMILGAPTGSFKGVGTLNATEVYNDNVALTCAPVEHAISGTFDLAKWDGLVPSGRHDAAHVYDEMLQGGYQPKSAASFGLWVHQHGAVPGLITPAEWSDMDANDRRPGVGQWGQRLALALDFTALAMMDMEQRLQLLEATR